MGLASPPRSAVKVDTRSAITDGGEHLTVNLYHLDKYNDPSQRTYYIEHIVRPAEDKPANWNHTRSFTGKTARARAFGEWAAIRQMIDERTAPEA